MLPCSVVPVRCWNEKLIGWKPGLTFSFSVDFFLVMWVEAAALSVFPLKVFQRQTRALCTSVCLSVRVSFFTLREDWGDCCIWACSETQIAQDENIINILHVVTLQCGVPRLSQICLSSVWVHNESGFSVLACCHDCWIFFWGAPLLSVCEWGLALRTTRACCSNPSQSFACGQSFKCELLLGR